MIQPITILSFGFSPGMATTSPPITPMTDLNNPDRGLQYQHTPTYLGPTVGWLNLPVLPARYANSNITVTAGDATILIDATVMATVNLPSVAAWVNEPHYRPFDPFSRGLWLKDITGGATLNNVTILPFAGEKIDGLSLAILSTNFGIVRLYPLTDLTGWYRG